MAESNIVNISGATLRDQLREQAAQRYAPEAFQVPDWEGMVDLRRLKAIEQDELYAFQRANAPMSQVSYNAKEVSLGLVNPKLTYDEAMEMPEDWLAAVAGRIEEKTNAHRVVEEKKAADEPAPFIVPSSGTTASPSPSEKPSEKSKS